MASQSARDWVFWTPMLRSAIYRTPLHRAVREPVLGGDERPAPTRRGVSTVSRATGVSHVYRGAVEARARNEGTVDTSVRHQSCMAGLSLYPQATPRCANTFALSRPSVDCLPPAARGPRSVIQMAGR